MIPLLPLALLLVSGASGAPADDVELLPDDTDEPADILDPDPDELGTTPLTGPVELEIIAPPDGGMSPEEEAALHEVAALIDRGDTERASLLAASFATGGTGRAAAAAWLAVAVLEANARPTLASEAFAEAARIDGPLQPWATWLAAEHHAAHNDAMRAIEAASAYLERWPFGPRATECQGILALSFAAIGQEQGALAAADHWTSRVRRDSLDDPIALEFALQTAKTSPEAAVPALQRLATRFVSPEVGERAALTLHRLEESGVPGATLPDDLPSLQARATSFREAGLVDQAWAVFVAIRLRGATDPAAAQWADQQTPTFCWSTRQWDQLESWYRKRFAANPSSETAWDAWRAATRGGRYDAARGWLHEAMARWPGSGRFVGSAESVGRALLIGGDAAEAAIWFDRVARGSGVTGRRNAFLAALSRWRAGETDAAVAAFTSLLSTHSVYEVEARYWRARALDATDPAQSQADREWVLREHPDSWYALLIRSRVAALPRDARDGLWPARRGPAAWSIIPIEPSLPPLTHSPLPRSYTPAWQAGASSRQLPTSAPTVGYPEGPYFRAETARAVTLRFAERWGERWPDLHAAADLSRVGLYDLAGPLFSATYSSIRAASYRGDRGARAAAADLDAAERLPMFLFVRDHHHTAKDTIGLASSVTDPADHLATERLAMPVAYPGPVWSAARTAGIDPWLALSIMRAESVYDANAVSRAGARGPMQILPRTGYLLAALDDDAHFTARSLHAPLTAVSLGIRYLGLLADRFDAVAPLAVASYNAGPHNVAAWMEGMGAGTPLDLFAEAIPLVETRSYVRKVMLNYDRYIQLYGDSSERVVLPDAVAGDHPAIVDF